MAARESGRAITIVHLSDLRFGWGHRFGSLAPPTVDDTFEALTAAVCEDLGKVRDAAGGVVEPDLLLLSGDLTENARPSELKDVLRFVDSLARALGLGPHRVAVVPGNRDVSLDACAAYFSNCRAEEKTPEPPYWPKWRPYAAFFRDLYGDHPDAAFEEGRPWTLFEVPDLKVMIAGLNSTLAESHEEHRGWLGAEQLRWFAGELEQARHNGWLRIALLHHDPWGGPTRREETLHDAADLQEILAPQVNLVLHGHGHDSGVRLLVPEVPAFAAGTPEPGAGPAVTPAAPAAPVSPVSRYQILQVREDQVQRWSRVCEPLRSRWHEDASGNGRLSIRLPHTDETFRGGPSGPAAVQAPLAPVAEMDDLLARVARILHLEDPKAKIQRRRSSRSAQDYLVVTEEEGGMARSYPVGALARTVRPEDLAAFVTGVHRRYQERDSGVISRLVYTGPPVLGTLAMEAREQKVRLLRLPELERQLMDLVPLVERQNRRLEEDTLYPQSLYVQQRTRFEDAGEPQETGNTLALIHGWVGSDEGRFILVLGDPGTGKTFLLRELARRIAADKDRDIVPILIEMRNLNKSRSLEELVGQHFAQEGVDFFPHRFRYLLENGRVALLFDGFDELATQMTYDRAADHLATLRQAAVKAAKVVVTSRRQHFLSEQNLLTGMGEQVEQVAGRRMTILQPFDSSQIAEFLQRRCGDKEEAARRMRLYEEVRILGLARNPRMLGFISDLKDDQLRSAGGGDREILKHEVYDMLVERWLHHETERTNQRGARPGLAYDQLRQTLLEVSERIWKAPDHTINIRELKYEVGMVLRTLSDRERDTAAFQVGSGTLLARDEDGNFSFFDASILEWFVARKAADELQAGRSPDILSQAAASDDMLDFFIRMAGTQAAVRWARQMRNDPHPAVSENAQRLLNLVPEETGRQRNLAGQDLRWQDLSNQDLIEADLSRADLSGVKLLETDLTSATLTGARLVRADLSRARLRGTDLAGADLTGASLLRADLTGARLEGTVLRYAKLIGAVYDDSAFQRCDSYGAALQPRSVQTVAGASLPVAAVAWSANGEWLAVASGSAVDLWETHSWKAVRRLTGARDRIRCVVFGRGDRLVAAGSEDGVLHVWDAATGQRLPPVRPHADAICGLGLEEDGRAVTASLDGTAAVWDLEQGQKGEIARFRGHRGPIRSLSLQGAGKLATGGEDGTIRRWDAVSGRESRALETVSIPLAIGFSPRGSYFVAATDDRRLLVWTLRTQEDPWRSEPLGGATQALAFSEDERHLALALDDRTVRLLDLASKREVACLAGHEAPVRTVAFRPGSRTILVSGGDDGTLRVWNEGREERQAAGFRCGVRRLAFGRDGASLVSVLGDGTVRNWDLGTGTAVLQRLGGDSVSVWQRSSLKVRPELDDYLQKQVRGLAVALSPDGITLATGAQDSTVRLWDLESRSQLRSWEEHSREVRSVAYSPDGQVLASASADRTVRLWGSRGATLVLRHREAVTQVAFAPEGRRLASSCMDGAVRLWNLELGRELLVFPGRSPALAVAFSPDGRRVAGAFQDRSVRIWSLEDRREQGGFDGPRGALAVVFTPDGAGLAAAGEDGSIWIWQGEQSVRLLEGHIAPVRELVFSPDRQLLASGSDDNTIRLWDTQTWECLAVLAPLREGWAAFRPAGRFRTSRATGGGFWHVVGLCRFEPGELSAYAPDLSLDEEPLFDPAARRRPS